MAAAFRLYWGLTLFLTFYHTPCTPRPDVHIVYLGLGHGQDTLVTRKLHVQLLSSAFSSENEAEESILYNYKHAFSGFAAMLNSTQATILASNKRVISVFRSRILKLHTTRSWDFMGLTLDPWKTKPMRMNCSDDNIVGIFDTGIWPESESFREEPGMAPVPPSWRGKCVKGDAFDPKKACNRKLIGARYYVEGFERSYGALNLTATDEYRSPRDRIGHGTHTASIAVGSPAANASYYGLASGVARGGAPRARLAVYKVCWLKDFQGACSEADILAAFDEALRDGVHVISASLGAPPPLMPFFRTSTDIGAFHAAQRGVTVVFSAGNDGAESSLVQNVSPWSLCVAAGTIDRTFPTSIVLGNNLSFTGQSFIRKKISTKLVESGQLFEDGSCSIDKWNGKAASGSIVLCFSSIGQVTSGVAALSVLAANGSAMIFSESMTRQAAQEDFLPTVHVDLHQGTQILDYIQFSMRKPTVEIFPSSTDIGHTPAPSVAYFSSRGPSSASPNILKPDITAPGVNIIGAWSPVSSPTVLPFDSRSVKWNIDSGTSMSCPHVSGIVALIKSAHPDWSPAAIKSAIMTTAYMHDKSTDSILAGGTLKPADAFDVGAGHVDPLKAMDPGLVYDMETRDYVIFLCSLGYTQEQIKGMLLPSPAIDTSCNGRYSDLDMNYPAITISDLRSTITIKRTVRNVGRKNAVYFVSITDPEGVKVSIWPMVMVFSRKRERVSYYVTITPVKWSKDRYDFGEIVWCDGHHRVRIPLSVRINSVNDGGQNAGGPHFI